MLEFLDRKITNFISYVTVKKHEFKNDERGVSPVVATVLLIVICVALAIAFKDNLMKWFNKMWDQIMKAKI